MKSPRIYRYIIRHDDGYAPCTDNGFLTLATCKPSIRSAANIGDWVAGYMPKGLGEGLLVWFGRIEKTMSPIDYGRVYRGRKDAQYRLGKSGNIERAKLWYHPDADQQQKDLRSKVLIFDPEATWYFGGEPIEPPSSLDFLKPEGQGHRVNLRRPNNLDDMLAWLKSERAPSSFSQPRSAIDEGCGVGCGPRRKTLQKQC